MKLHTPLSLNMNINKRDNLNVSTKENQTPLGSESKGVFLNNSHHSNIPQNKQRTYTKAELNRVLVHNHIKKTEPTSIYKVHKDLQMAYNTVSYIVRDLIFAGVVAEQMGINDSNVAVKVLTIPKEVAKDVD